MSSEIVAAKQALDRLIKKSRVHLYKPIQIAEILYHHRTQDSSDIQLNKLETYRSISKKWRDTICLQFVGRVSTSSARYQDNLFEDNAIPPPVLEVLGKINNEHDGGIEAYIYRAFEKKHLQLKTALNYCLENDRNEFHLDVFLDQFWKQPGLKRSLDKIFEIVVYALFEVLAGAIEVTIDISFNPQKQAILEEFHEFGAKVLELNPKCNTKRLNGHFYRVGVTNAADRGLDMYANFGSVVQIKHLSLDQDLAEGVVTSITSDRIIIVCKNAEKAVIQSLLNQIGWRSRIQSIITFDELTDWYNRALRGKYSDALGDSILSSLAQEIRNEFPAVDNNDFEIFKQERGYDRLDSPF